MQQQAPLRRARAILLGGLLAALPACYQPKRVDCAVSCETNGSCPAEMTCSHGLCVHAGGDCQVALCESGTTQCGDGEAVLTCDAQTDTLRASETCSDATPVCVAGACAECAPGESYCVDAGSRIQCGADATWQGEASDCVGPTTICSFGVCTSKLQIALGGAHACARSADGSVRCWGDNAAGQLGLGDTQNRAASPPSQTLARVNLLGDLRVARIAAGLSHTCAVIEDGSLYCWGQNGSGQLGLGDRLNRGDSLTSEPVLVDLGRDRQAIGVALGARHSCALLRAGRVKCWGDNQFGQLGLGDTRTRGDDPAEMGDDLPEVPLANGRAVVQLAAGGYFTCALFADGQVKCWGINELGQLGRLRNDDRLNRGDDPGELGDALPAVQLPSARSAIAISAGFTQACALLDDHSVSCWGGGNAVLNQLATDVSVVSVGNSHACAVFTDQRVRCWGNNWTGELGTGDTDDRHGDKVVAVDLGTLDGKPLLATDVRASVDFSCAVLETGEVKCWGINQRGQLGVFSTETKGDAGGELGDALPSVPLAN